MCEGEAWVTLSTNDSYALGALVLAQSLRRVGTTRQKVIMITNGVSSDMQQQLRLAFDSVVDVGALDSGDVEALRLLDRPELGCTFTKLHCWRLTQFSKCVFLDADTLVLQNSDDLFDREELSAAPDAGWPDCFNSGVFVFRPSLETHRALIAHAKEKGSFDGGDQGLLNTFFSGWATEDITRHLPFVYNMCATATYSYLPAYKKFGHDARIVHFIGAVKPWQVRFDSSGAPASGPGSKSAVAEANMRAQLQTWWNIFHADVKPRMGASGGASGGAGDAPMSGGAGDAPTPAAAPGQASTSASAAVAVAVVVGGESAASASGGHSGGVAETPTPTTTTQTHRVESARDAWERGQPDYMGEVSFENILKKMETTMAEKKPDEAEKKVDEPAEEEA